MSATGSDTNGEQPLVSCVVIFLNAAKYLAEAIASIQAQSYPHWELLLVDDGSTDGSTEIARQFAREDPDRIRYLEHDGHVNRGMSATRNLGFRHARGKYVALLDGDDVWLPHKLTRQVAMLEARPETGMVFGPTEYWHSWTGAAEDFARDHVPTLGVPVESLHQPPALLNLLYPLGQGPAPCLCALLIRRDVIERVGGFEESFAGFYEDQAFLTKVYLTTPVFVSGECWDRYRIHPESCSATVERAGEYDAYRQSFLEWLKHYLEDHRVDDSSVWDSMNAALRPYQSDPGARDHRWFLRVADDNMARLVQPADRPDTVRVDIMKARSQATYDIQLNLPGLKVQANDRLVLTFRARADWPRTAGCGFAMGHSPWKNLGLYATLDLVAEWAEFRQEFVVEQDEADARVHFDLGGNEASVEIASLMLQHADGRVVRQERAPAAIRAGTDQASAEPAVPFGEVEFGSFRRLTPISRDFGCDRGRPIDRYYIENFLEANRADVRGRVLEIGENTYTRRYGGDQVTVSDILHVMEGEPGATIIADLATADHIPSDAFDCIILTQTLQLIYDVPAAVRHIHRILKPGGVLLATFPGISQTYDHEWAGTWYWNFTALSARRVFADTFEAHNVEVQSFGNVLAAMSFLHGLAVEELTPAELDHREAGYDVTLAVRAVKRPRGEGGEGPASPPDAGSSARRTSGGSGDPRGIILMYHRVAEGSTDPFSLAVAPAHFAEQLEVLGKRTVPMRLEDFARALRHGELPGGASVVTFDDGYADNLLNAKPLLERSGVPATVFLTTGYVGGEREFWWDEVDHVLLQPGTLPRVLRLHIAGDATEWDLGADAVLSEAAWRRTREWRVSEPPPTARHATFLSLWKLLQFTAGAGRRQALDELHHWAGLDTAPRATHRLLSVPEVSDLVRGDTIEAGAHTVTHPVLAKLPAEEQEQEIQGSKAAIERILGRPVSSFSYPFGSRPDFTSSTMDIVRASGFTCACSTVPATVKTPADLFQLPRFQVNDWGRAEFDRRLVHWLGARV